MRDPSEQLVEPEVEGALERGLVASTVPRDPGRLRCEDVLEPASLAIRDHPVAFEKEGTLERTVAWLQEQGVLASKIGPQIGASPEPLTADGVRIAGRRLLESCELGLQGSEAGLVEPFDHFHCEEPGLLEPRGIPDDEPLVVVKESPHVRRQLGRFVNVPRVERVPHLEPESGAHELVSLPGDTAEGVHTGTPLDRLGLQG